MLSVRTKNAASAVETAGYAAVLGATWARVVPAWGVATLFISWKLLKVIGQLFSRDCRAIWQIHSNVETRL